MWYTRHCTVTDLLRTPSCISCKLRIFFFLRARLLLKSQPVHHSHWSINKVVCRRGEVAVLCPKITRKWARSEKSKNRKSSLRCSSRTINLIILTFYPSVVRSLQCFAIFLCLALANSPASRHKKRSKQPTYKIKESSNKKKSECGFWYFYCCFAGVCV